MKDRGTNMQKGLLQRNKYLNGTLLFKICHTSGLAWLPDLYMGRPCFITGFAVLADARRSILNLNSISHLRGDARLIFVVKNSMLQANKRLAWYKQRCCTSGTIARPLVAQKNTCQGTRLGDEQVNRLENRMLSLKGHDESGHEVSRGPQLPESDCSVIFLKPLEAVIPWQLAKAPVALTFLEQV